MQVERVKAKKEMGLLDAIRICHAGKYERLNVTNYHGFFAQWDQDDDTGWQEYRAARDKLSRHRILTWVLEHVRLI